MDHYASGVLKPDVHGRLVADIDRIATEAGIQPYWISRPLAATCSEVEVEWVRGYRQHAAAGRSGLMLLGKWLDPDPETRMSALTGALTRNFVAAQLMPLNALLASANNGDVPVVSCLLVPNFFVVQTKGGVPPWRVQVLLDTLLSRHAAGRQTVLYVSDLAGLTSEYGDAVRRHIEAHYAVESGS